MLPPPAGGGAPNQSIGDVARDAARRVRKGLGNMVDAMSREMRALGNRVQEQRSRRSGQPGPSRPARDAYGYFDSDERGRTPVSRGREPVYSYDDDNLAPETPRRVSHPHDDQALRPVNRAVTSASQPSRALSHPHRSLVLRLRNRRRKLQGEKYQVGLAKTTQTVLIVFFLVLIAGGGALSGYSYFLIQKNAQAIQLLAINRDFQTTRIYDRNGVLLYQIFGNDVGRRDYISYCQLPQTIKDFTVTTEDGSFWNNPGVDVAHELSSALTDFKSGGAVTGASTITQQLVKNAVLQDDRKDIGRKFDENILAIDITQHYTKQQILTMYLNQVGYGALDYGVEAAAENYFGYQPHTIDLNANPATLTPDEQSYLAYVKDPSNGCTPPPGQKSVVEAGVWQLQPWQAALLAGVPQNPPAHSPFDHPESAVVRMKEGVLPNIYKQGKGGELTLNGQPVSEQDDEKLVDTAWLNICEADPSPLSDGTIPTYLPKCPNNLNTRHIKDTVTVGSGSSTGNAGAELAPFFIDYVLNQLDQYLPRDVYATRGWNIYTTLDYGDPSLTDAELSHVTIDYNTGKLEWDTCNCTVLKENGKSINISQVGLQQYAEYITRRNITGEFPDYWYSNSVLSSPCVKYPPPGTHNPFGSDNQPICYEAPLNTPESVYINGKSGRNANDAALVAIDPRNGDILAMVGGIDFDSKLNALSGGQLNVATDPYRSMGSSTKPLVYATAFQMGWNPGTIVRDQPTCYPYAVPPSDEVNPKVDTKICPGNYLPHNYVNDEWFGAVPARVDLGDSLNTPATLALNFTGLRADSPFLTMARRLGVTTLTPNALGPSTALGSQGISLLDLTSAYGTFANLGLREPERAILQITDALGNQVTDDNGTPFFPYNPNPQGYQAISPQTAYQVTSILTDNDARVSEFGPDNPLYFPGRETAGKTGTSQSIEDIVTMGYLPTLALGVWVGNADKNNTPMNPQIIGIAGAAYIFNAVMAFAIDHYHMPGTPPSYGAPTAAGGSFLIPPGMHRAILSCATGLAPYAGKDAQTSTSGKGCDPTSNPVPAAMAGDFYQGKWHCGAWGCDDVGNDSKFPGIDIAWLPDGEDPVSP